MKKKAEREKEEQRMKLDADVQAAETEILPILAKYNLGLTILYKFSEEGAFPFRGTIGFRRVQPKPAEEGK